MNFHIIRSPGAKRMPLDAVTFTFGIHKEVLQSYTFAIMDPGK